MSGAQEVIFGGRVYFLRQTTVADAPEVLRLFTQVFGERPPRGWFRWKYGPTGLQGRAMGLWDDVGNLVAHCGGFPRRLLWRGQTIAALQIGDVMVAPKERGWFTRHGPFFTVCAAFYRHWIGAGKPFVVSYGFPHERHMRLGVHLGLYQDMGSVQGWQWPAQALRPSWAWQARETQPQDKGFDTLIDKAWHAMKRQASGKILGVRDSAYVRTRFVARPGVYYRFLRVQRMGIGPAAVVIFREDGETLRWVDYIGPPTGLAPSARALQAMAACLGLAYVESWASAAAGAELASAGGRHVHDAARFALVNPSQCPDASLADRGWWLAGDTDFL